MKAAKSKKVSNERIASRAMQHCTVAQSVRVGERALTNDGHVVERSSASEWIVLEPASNDERYGAGTVVMGRTLFWRMNGLGRRLSA